MCIGVFNNTYSITSHGIYCIVIVCCSSVPSFMTEWYWRKLIDGDTDFVEFHNRVYGCSGVNPDKFPCTGPNFTSVSHHLLTCCKLCVCVQVSGVCADVQGRALGSR